MDSLVQKFISTFVTDDRWVLFLKGWGTTVAISIFAVLVGVALGVLIAVCKVYTAQTGKLKILDKILSVYVAIVRGTPVVLQVMIMYYIILVSVSNTLFVAVMAFGINSIAYVSEIVRAGISSIDPGQMEAGRSLGLSRMSTMRYIILPQAIKNILPALGNEFIALLKETSVVGFIPLTDLTKASDFVRSRTYDAFFPLIAAALIYFVMVMLLSLLMKKLEKRLAKSDRR